MSDDDKVRVAPPPPRKNPPRKRQKVELILPVAAVDSDDSPNVDSADNSTDDTEYVFDGSDEDDEDDDSGSGSDSDSEIDPEEWFEQESARFRQTIVQHVLAKLTKLQRNALKLKIQQGVDEAFEVCDDIVTETYKQITEQRVTSNYWKLGLEPDEIKKYAPMIRKLYKEHRKRISPIDILNAKLPNSEKMQLIELYNVWAHIRLSPESYQDAMSIRDKIYNTCKNSHNLGLSQKQVDDLEKVEQQIDKQNKTNLPLKLQILAADMDIDKKAHIYEKFQLLEKSPESSSTANTEEWIREALKTPYSQVTATTVATTATPYDCLLNLRQTFESHMSELDREVIEPLMAIFNNKLYNPNYGSLIIGFLGSPGTGKTAAAKAIAQACKLPFDQISMGGMVDATVLDGQHPGWVGAQPGRFVKALQRMKNIHGVLFLDEVDKLVRSVHGQEVQASLLHSLDPEQNYEYTDHYLGHELPVDLSKLIMICGMNDISALDPALLSRMHIIRLKDYTGQQKSVISLNHLGPRALENAGLTDKDVVFTKEATQRINELLDNAQPKEGGVRLVKSCIAAIVDKLALLLRYSLDERVQLKLSFAHVNIGDERPVRVTPQLIDALYENKSEMQFNVWKQMYV